MASRRGLWAEPRETVPPARLAARRRLSSAFDVLPPVSDADADESDDAAAPGETAQTEAASLGEN